MADLYIHQHMGLGDHILCNGLVRFINSKKEYENIFIFCKEKNLKELTRLFQDLDNIKLIPTPAGLENSTVELFLQSNKSVNVLKVGFSAISEYMNSGKAKTFDQAFYLSAGISYEEKYKSFKFLRNYSKEEEIYNLLNPTNEKYIFVHDDEDRGYKITFNTDLKIIKNNINYSMFDMVKLLENAQEIHCMESSFRCFIDQLDQVKCPLILHTYIRGLGEDGKFVLSDSRKEWIYINEAIL